MNALLAERSPLALSVEQLQHMAGMAANDENTAGLAAELLTGQNGLQACARIIMRDLVLTLRVLQIANSASYNLSGQTVLNVTHATALLGTDVVGQMVETVPRQALSHPVRELALLSRITALIARHLVCRVEPRFAEEAMVTGLFRNIGELSYAVARADEYETTVGLSQGTMAGLRASCRMQARFDFDELSVGLLRHWHLSGPPVMAAQSTPEALAAQHGNAEAEIALAASVAHLLTTAYFRCEGAERERLMRPCWAVLGKQFQLNEAQAGELCDTTFEATAGPEDARPRLQLREWVPTITFAELTAEPGATLPSGSTMGTLLKTAIAKGIDRAAWLAYSEPDLRLGAVAGDGWPVGGAQALPALLNPRKPPFLLAFGQRQDVWIDFGKDRRFREAPLALAMKPAAFFLLPVCDGRRVRGCLYFDWATRRDQPPESVLPALLALRDFMASHMPVV